MLERTHRYLIHVFLVSLMLVVDGALQVICASGMLSSSSLNSNSFLYFFLGVLAPADGCATGGGTSFHQVQVLPELTACTLGALC